MLALSAPAWSQSPEPQHSESTCSVVTQNPQHLVCCPISIHLFWYNGGQEAMRFFKPPKQPIWVSSVES